MRVAYLSKILIVTLLMQGCAATKQSSSTLPPLSGDRAHVELHEGKCPTGKEGEGDSNIAPAVILAPVAIAGVRYVIKAVAKWLSDRAIQRSAYSVAESEPGWLYDPNKEYFQTIGCIVYWRESGNVRKADILSKLPYILKGETGRYNKAEFYAEFVLEKSEDSLKLGIPYLEQESISKSGRLVTLKPHYLAFLDSSAKVDSDGEKNVRIDLTFSEASFFSTALIFAGSFDFGKLKPGTILMENAEEFKDKARSILFPDVTIREIETFDREKLILKKVKVIDLRPVVAAVREYEIGEGGELETWLGGILNDNSDAIAGTAGKLFTNQ